MRKTGRTAALRNAAAGIIFLVERNSSRITCATAIRIEDPLKVTADPFAIARECNFELEGLVLSADLVNDAASITRVENIALGYPNLPDDKLKSSSSGTIWRRVDAMTQEVGPPETFGALAVRVGAAIWVKRFLLDGQLVGVPEMLARTAYPILDQKTIKSEPSDPTEDEDQEEDDGDDVAELVAEVDS